jgi:CDP-4-dehydro-6-deoxyglucose reductase
LRYYPVLSAQPEAAERMPGARSGWVHEVVLADHACDADRVGLSDDVGRTGGRADAEHLRRALALHEVYVAGPPALVEAVRASFPAHGLPPGQLYFDSFDYAPDSQPSV